jgi:8-oxo-dGTP pyrophosphatase MutT (NUDIX family)
MKKGIDYPGVTISFFCHDGERNFVMSKRSQNCRDEQGCWDIGAGGLDLGDSVEETLKKEIAEEYCTDILEYEFLGYRDLFREHEGQKTHWVALDFKVLINKEKLANGEPHKFDEVGWFTRETLPEKIHSQNPAFFETYKEKLFASK